MRSIFSKSSWARVRIPSNQGIHTRLHRVSEISLVIHGLQIVVERGVEAGEIVERRDKAGALALLFTAERGLILVLGAVFLSRVDFRFARVGDGGLCILIDGGETFVGDERTVVVERIQPSVDTFEEVAGILHMA